MKTTLTFFFILQLEGDDRSDEEEDDSEPQSEKQHKVSHINGSGIRGRANGHWHLHPNTPPTAKNEMDGSIFITAVRI